MTGRFLGSRTRTDGAERCVRYFLLHYTKAFSMISGSVPLWMAAAVGALSLPPVAWYGFGSSSPAEEPDHHPGPAA